MALLLVAGTVLAACGSGAPSKQADASNGAAAPGKSAAPKDDPLPAMRDGFRQRFRESLALLDGLAACEGAAGGPSTLAVQMRPIWADEVRRRAAAARIEEDAVAIVRENRPGGGECTGPDPVQAESLAAFERLQTEITRRLAAIADATRARSVAP